MTKINIPVKINIPESIEVRLVREDFLDTSNIFRILFEIFIALFAGISGAYITLKELSFIHWLLFSLLLILSGIFLYLWVKFYQKSKVHEIPSGSDTKLFPFKINGFLANIRLTNIEEVQKILSAIPEINITWHNNKIKTEYRTLKIKNITNERLAELLNLLRENNIDFVDEKITL